MPLHKVNRRTPMSLSMTMPLSAWYQPKHRHAALGSVFAAPDAMALLEADLLARTEHDCVR